MRLLSLAVLASAFFFHTHLKGSFPKADETVTAQPSELRLWFSARPELKLTSIRLVGADSVAVPLAATVAGADTLTVRAPIARALKPGTYAVLWRTAARDGHVVRGRYEFTYTSRP